MLHRLESVTFSVIVPTVWPA